MYLALARKYRPQQFKDLIGQPHVTKTLQNAIKMNKLYPAMIFSGMKGVGKTSAARVLAKALNCEKGPDIEPCNACQICLEITDDKSPDYIEIDGASNNGVEEVRNLRENVRYKPLKNRYKIIVIDEVHMLSNSAWNALLKTVEEPPDFTYFILATTDFHKIPATIVSRCQHFEFKRIPYEIIISLLKEICKKEDLEISEYALYLIAKSSEGSLRDAKKILDQAIALSSGNVHDNDVIEILGIVEEEIFIKLTQCVLTQNRKEIIGMVHELCERGIGLRFFYNEYLKFFRDLIIFKSVDQSEKYSNLNPENFPEIREMLKNVRDVELLRLFNAAKDLEITIKNTENPRIILEYLFLKLSYFPALVSIEELINDWNPSSASGSGSGTPPSPSRSPDKETQTAGSAVEAKSKHPSTIVTTAGDLSSEIQNLLSKERPRIASALQSAAILQQKNNISITFPGKNEYAFKHIRDNADYIKKKIYSIVGDEVDIQFHLEESGTPRDDKTHIKDLKKDEKIGGLVKKIKGKIISIEGKTGGIDG